MIERKNSIFPVLTLVILATFLISTFSPGATPADKKKKEALASIDKHQAEIIALSDRIWQLAETALEETQSSKLLADYAEAQGFKVERGVAGLPTAFVATYGQDRPVIGVLGEYDALPGLSQKAQPVKEALQPGAAGHGCGHNLLGTAALSSALAIKELIESGKLKGTVRFYGTPAEEATGGKVYMVRAGLFNDLDACLTWHPGQKNEVSVDGSQAIVEFIVEFLAGQPMPLATPGMGEVPSPPWNYTLPDSTGCVNSSSQPSGCTIQFLMAEMSPTLFRPMPDCGAGCGTQKEQESNS